MVRLVVGSMICKDGILALAASDGGDEMNLAACHKLDSSSPSNQSIQCLAFAVLSICFVVYGSLRV